MAKITEIEKGRFVAVLSQQELNTISLLLGHSSDGLVTKLGEDFEDYPEEALNADINYLTGNKATSLHSDFKKYRTVLEESEGC
ncbi:hypothetical protein MG295_00262 [Bacillus phage vB_BcgM]|nr:hypothetical protein MG295_00262 [Bacillus phage vB_BcgM]